MPGRALSPSPIAVFLLGLAERGADGSVEVGGRHVLLRKGQVVDVRPADGDGDLPAFLRDSGRVAPEPLDRCTARAREEGLPLEEVLVRQRLLSSEAVRDVRRGLWLDRLVRGMARAAAEGRDVSPVQAEARVPEGASTSLVTLVLDALERRAADHDAGQVGARADHRLEWLPSVHLERATRWARFDAKDARGPVAGLLKTEPAAAPRIAALVRAGLARIVSPDAPPAPAPRVGPLPSTAAPSRATPPLGSIATDFEPGRRKVSVELDPALSPIFGDQPALTTELPALASPVGTLDDPLDALERQIALLEQASAPGRERALAWRRFGDAWERRFGSLEEATRAYREAAAADGEDRLALGRASELCAALGQADLAVAYARAAVAQAPQGPERTSALFGYALLARRLGKVSEALGALRAAAAADPSDPEPLALSVHLWRELGRPRDAADAASDAATRVGEGERALSLRALALALDPRSAARAEAYATELAASGLTEAAIAVRAEAVRHSADADVRRSLLLAAAEQAELADRPDVAAELLIRAFDAEPHVDLLYEPLDADLAHAQAPLERALLLEEIAAASPSEARAGWLMRAADARFDLPGDGGWETELRARALELEPEDAEGWRAIGEQAAAQGDPRLLADVLERAVLRGRFRGAEAERRALEELARVAERDLGAPARAAWAWSRRAALGGDETAARELARLAPALEAHRARSRELEGAALADHLADDPERRREALAIYRELLEAGPDDRARAGDLGAAIERIERLLGEESGATLALRAERASGRAERSRLRLRQAALRAMAGRFDEAALACRQILDELPTHREAALRLRRAASRLGDRDLLREALAAETALALAPQQRARVLTALALELEDAGSVDEAISCAEAALTADPGSAEAALLVTRHLGAVEQPRAALGVVRALFGDSPPILEAWARVARGSGEREAMLEALDAWARAAPYDPEPCAVRLAAFPASEATEVLVSAIEGALAPERLVPSLAGPLAGAIARLAELGELPQAATLAVRSADALGPHGDPLRELAGRLAASTGDRELRRAALERRIAPQIEDGRVELLHELAALHSEGGDRAAEARTHLRVLAVRPHEARSLERLVALYAETGETDRLMAALALELEAAPEAERIKPLLKLAATSAQLRGDLDRAEGFLRDAWKPELETDEPLLQAAGALVALGRARRAVELLREAGRKVPPRRAAPIYVRAVQIALKKVGDPRLSLAAAVEGLDAAPSSGHLLLAFEQIALELTDVDLAQRTYQRLLDRAMGPHGRRALGYRRARWLERVGGARAALDAYLETFARAPQGGVVYASIERLARELGDLEALASAALVLAEQAAHPAVRRSMAREAARLFEHELRDGERAFDVLVRLWEDGDAGVEDQLLRLASEARRVDVARGEAAFARVLDGLRKRAEDAWMGEARARLLLRQGRLHALGRGDLGAARAAVEEALAAARDDGGDASLLAELHLALASWLLEAGELEPAAAQVRHALEAHPASEPGQALAAQLGIALDIQPNGDGPSITGNHPQAAENVESPPEVAEISPQVAGISPPIAEISAHVAEISAHVAEISPGIAGDGPDVAEISPRAAGSEPDIAGNAPRTAGSQPDIAGNAPRAAGSQPDIAGNAPRAAGSEPDIAGNAPRTAGSEPDIAGNARRAAGSEPNIAGNAPQATGSEPDIAGNEPNIAGNAPDIAGNAPDIAGNAPDIAARGREDADSAVREVSSALREERPSRALRPPRLPAVPSVSLAGGAADASPPPPPSAARIVAFGPGAVAGAGGAAPTRVLVPSAMGRWLPSAPPDEPDDASALEARAAESPERAAELLRAALVLEPHRLSALRALAEHPGASPARHLARSLLALSEPDLAPPEPLVPPHRSRLPALLRDEALGATEQIWALLWEQAQPLFREIPAPREPNTRVTRVAMTPEARAFAAALDALGRDDLPEFYFERSAEPGLFLARTAAPRILGGPAFAPDEPSMRFALARLLELSRSENLLIATLPSERADMVAAAVAAAFGPADGGAVAREAAALASELWRTMPARSQVSVRELLLEAGDGWLDTAGARRAAEVRAQRAGLIACGDLGVAVREACAADPELASLDLGTERGLVEALRAETIAALVRFAFGPLAT